MLQPLRNTLLHVQLVDVRDTNIDLDISSPDVKVLRVEGGLHRHIVFHIALTGYQRRQALLNRFEEKEVREGTAQRQLTCNSCKVT